MAAFRKVVYIDLTKGISHFKSPLTGEWGESYAGGRLVLAMRFAKAEPIVVRVASESPCYISINDANIEIKDVTSIWGVDARTTMAILREH
jgi:aldehyde:ferredoxin oxidoreductase